MNTSAELRTAWVTLSTSSRHSSAQRGGLVIKALFYALVFSIIAALWRSAADANNGSVAGFSARQLTWYIALSEAVTISMNNRLLADVGADITSGAVAIEMLQPKSVLAQRILRELGRVLPALLACTLTGIAVSWLVAGPPAGAAALTFAAPALVLAVACNIVGHHLFGSVAFWLRDTGAMWFVYQKFVFMLGGMLLPLEVLPDWLRHIALFTPFPSMAYVPATLGSGHGEPWLLGVQAGWLAVLLVGATAAFRMGQRRLLVDGG